MQCLWHKPFGLIPWGPPSQTGTLGITGYCNTEENTYYVFGRVFFLRSILQYPVRYSRPPLGAGCWRWAPYWRMGGWTIMSSAHLDSSTCPVGESTSRTGHFTVAGILNFNYLRYYLHWDLCWFWNLILRYLYIFYMYICCLWLTSGINLHIRPVW